MSYNPFRAAQYNSDIFPNSRPIQTSLGEKILDAYWVIAGATLVLNPTMERHFKRYNPKDRWGIFDYATLGIFIGIAALKTLFDNLYESNNKHRGIALAKALAFIPYLVITLAHFVGNFIIRDSLSTALTLAFSPIILASHFITQRIGAYKAKKVAQQIEVKECSVQDNKITGEAPTPIKLMKALIDLNASLQSDVSIQNTDGTKYLLIKNKKTNQERYFIFAQKDIINDPKNPLVEVSRSVRESTWEPYEKALIRRLSTERCP